MADLMKNLNQGRTVLIQFECGRCGKKHTEPFESFKVPDGWREHERNMPLLCPECHNHIHKDPFIQTRMIEEKCKELGVNVSDYYDTPSEP